MHRTTILLPEKLKQRANNKAKTLGLSLGEFIRKSLDASLKSNQPFLDNDPFLIDKNIYSQQIETDLSVSHDDYLYGGKE